MNAKNQNFSTKKVKAVEVVTHQGKIYIPVQPSSSRQITNLGNNANNTTDMYLAKIA
jgi:hypothetical protein